jgi:hypothetical protein
MKYKKPKTWDEMKKVERKLSQHIAKTRISTIIFHLMTCHDELELEMYFVALQSLAKQKKRKLLSILLPLTYKDNRLGVKVMKAVVESGNCTLLNEFYIKEILSSGAEEVIGCLVSAFCSDTKYFTRFLRLLHLVTDNESRGLRGNILLTCGIYADSNKYNSDVMSLLFKLAYDKCEDISMQAMQYCKLYC